MTGKIEEPLDTRVTKINNRWHCRLLRRDMVLDEMACDNQANIGYCIHEMLRWYDKMGYQPFSPMASSSRDRSNKVVKHNGKIWYQKDLKS